MLNRISFYLWYFFFSAYWSAHNWGATRPESNASGLFSIIVLLIFSTISQIFLYWGFEGSALFFIISVVLPALIIPYLLFRKNNKHFRKINQFEFLKGKSYNRKRVVIVALTFLFALILNTGVAILRNLKNTN